MRTRNAIAVVASCAMLVAGGALAGKRRSPRVHVVDSSKAKLSAVRGAVGVDGKLNLDVCFVLDEPVKHGCVRVDGAALLPILNDAPLEAWKDANGF